ncbi:MAG: RDD family protein [bacterium]|nr:RDD family protein [bacterium]
MTTEARPQRSHSPLDKGWVILGTGRQVRLARPSARLIAKIIDGIILVGVSFLITWGTQGFGNIVFSPPPPSYRAAAIASGLFGALYEIGFVAWRGQTLGKMATGIRIVGLGEGGLPGLGKSIRRWSLPAILAIPFYLVAEDPFSSGAALAVLAVAMVALVLDLLCHAWLLWDRIRRGWHDMIAGTIVVKVEGGTLDRYDREEWSHDRGDRDRRASEPPGSLGDFPWEDSGGGDQPAQSWEEAAPAGGGGAASAAPVAVQTQGNGLAIAGFVISILALLLSFVPALDLILVVLAIVFSTIGLRRANKQARPHRGLAIAGLTISLVALVLVIVLIAVRVASGDFGSA